MPAPGTRSRVLLGAALLAFVVLLAFPAIAQAHTELVYWKLGPGPAAGQQELLLRYSEPIDGNFLTVSVLDLQGKIVQSGGVSIDSQHRTDGRLLLNDLTSGIYSVAWWTRALDGDPSSGSFVLGVGTKAVPEAVLPPIGARDPATQPAMLWHGTVWNTILHWFIYLGAALLLAGLAFVLVIWRPASGRFSRGLKPDSAARKRVDEADRDICRTCRIIALSGAGLFLMTNLLVLVMEVGLVRYSLLQPVTSASPTPLGPSQLSHEAPYNALAEILSGYNGRVWLIRMGIGIVALLLALLPTARARYQNWRWLVAFVAALGTVFTVSLSAHAAVVPQASWARFLDWSHLVVMGAWVGGLLPLLLTTRRLRAAGSPEIELVPAVASRFSTFALCAFLFLAASGIGQAYLQVGNPDLLAPTLYGRALIAKLILFALLFVFGAVHRRLTLPQLRKDPAKPKLAFVRVVPAEFAVGASLLVAVALMASLGTSKAVWPAHESLGFYASTSTSGVTAVLRAVPGKAGENALALDVTDRRLGAPTVGGRVTIQLAGIALQLTPVEPLTPGTTQRFGAPAMVSVAQTNGPVSFTYERPSYPAVAGHVNLSVPAAVTGKK